MDGGDGEAVCGNMPSIIKVSGLDTADNPLSSVKDGSLKTADNCVIRSKNIIESRRGQYLYGGTFGGGSDRANAFTFFDSGTVLQYGTSLAQTTGTSNYSAISGTYTPADSTNLRMKFVEMAGNLYFNTTTGVKALDTRSTAVRAAGVPQALDIAAVAYVGTGGGLNAEPGAFLPVDSAVAYRLLWGVNDANGVTHWGAPSNRVVVINPPAITTSVVLSRTTNVVTATFTSQHGFRPNDFVYFTGVADGNFGVGPHHVLTVGSGGLTFTYAETAANGSSATTHTFEMGLATAIVAIPKAVDLSEFRYRIYRSAITASASVDPGDELYLVKELVTTTPPFIDTTPDLSLYSEPLYTNELTGDGALQANFQPPVAKDIARWNERMWFANTTGPYSYSVQMLGAASPDGWQSGDTFTVGGVTYTGNTDVTVYTAYTPTKNTEYSARDIASLVTSKYYVFGTSTVRAYYTSGANDAPGKLTFQEVGVGGSSFTFAKSRNATWSPATTTTQTATRDVFPNRVFYSKTGEPEAVPLLNYVDVGAKNKAILRIVPLREKLFVFKEDAIYTISGNAPNLRVDLLDNTAWLLAPDSAIPANNVIFALMNQGVCAITEGGVQILSLPVQNILETGFYAPINTGTTGVKAMVWGAAYETERSYVLGLTSSASSSTADQMLVYNYLHNTWTRWTTSARYALVNPTNDVLYLAAADTDQLVRERKSFTYADYADRTLAVTINSAALVSITLASASGVAAGDVIMDDSSFSFRLITDVVGNVLTVTSGTGNINTFAGAATVYKSIPVSLEFNPVSGGNPGTAKQFTSATLHFNRFNVHDSDLSTRTELATTATVDALTAVPNTYALTVEPTECVNLRKYIPLEKQRATLMRVGFNVSETWSRWQLNGFTLDEANTSDRNSR